MKIVVKNSMEFLKDSLNAHFSSSRFTFDIEEKRSKNNQTLLVRRVRLKESKPYCGNHPGACIVQGKKRKSKFLEGADWVNFNDTLNDWADSLELDANIESAVCVIRLGKKRRISYRSHNIRTGLAEWDKLGMENEYENYCLRVAPSSTFPWGTPGEQLWK